MDHNATTPPRAEVLEAMLPYLKEEFGNASSIHAFGRRAAIGINEAREKVAEALGCRPEEVVFTGCGTEADNLAIKGVAVSSGSACTSDSLEPSHVLLAMGVPPAIAQGSIRFSLGRDNTAEQVDYVLAELPAIIERLRAMSPFSAKEPFMAEAGPRRRK
jgi:cysteine sulfinate desulfinase/cysteine desulfurase-like protein